MHLARSKNGTIGRKIRSMGENAVIEAPAQGEHQTNVQVNYGSLAKDEMYWKEKEKKFQEKLLKAQEQGKNKARLQEKAFRAFQNSALQAQALISINPIEDALKKKFAREAISSQSANVVASLKPDFYDRELVPAPQEGIKSGVVPADYYMTKIVGNPLTRDGKYGSVTDFDRIVRGEELDNADVRVVGGTMVRRLPKTRPTHAQLGSSMYTPPTGTLSTSSTSTAPEYTYQPIDLPPEELSQLQYVGNPNLLPSTVATTPVPQTVVKSKMSIGKIATFAALAAGIFFVTREG